MMVVDNMQLIDDLNSEIPMYTIQYNTIRTHHTNGCYVHILNFCNKLEIMEEKFLGSFTHTYSGETMRVGPHLRLKWDTETTTMHLSTPASMCLYVCPRMYII